MRWVWVIVGHLVGIAALAALGHVVNSKIQPYAGYVTVLTGGLGLYSTALSILYRKNQAVYLAVNRLLLTVDRRHTYWLLDCHFDLKPRQAIPFESVIEKVAALFRSGRYGRAEVRTTGDGLSVLLAEEEIGLVFRVTERGLHLNTDRRVMVPSYLYEGRGRLLRSIALGVCSVVKPVRTRCTIEVFFRDGIRNPYYGFFVNRIPVGLLQDFQVVFRLDGASGCEIRAGKDHVGVEATEIGEGFDALSDVLHLRAMPVGEGR